MSATQVVRAPRIEVVPEQEVVEHDACIAADEATAKGRPVALRRRHEIAPTVGSLEMRGVLTGAHRARLYQTVLIGHVALAFAFGRARIVNPRTAFGGVLVAQKPPDDSRI
jgi:hypothetical protein